MDFLHSIFQLLKCAQGFPSQKNEVQEIKIYPVSLGPTRRRCEMLPSLSSIILYHHILPLTRLWKNYEIALQTSWHPGYGKYKLHYILLLTWYTQVSNLFCVGKGRQIYKNCTRNGGNNWG